MLFRVGRTLAVVACASAAAIEFALAADIPYVRSPPPIVHDGPQGPRFRALVRAHHLC